MGPQQTATGRYCKAGRHTTGARWECWTFTSYAAQEIDVISHTVDVVAPSGRKWWTYQHYSEYSLSINHLY